MCAQDLAPRALLFDITPDPRLLAHARPGRSVVCSSTRR